MFIKIKISNIGIFNETVEFDLLANKRDLASEDSIFEIDGLWINKTIGIIGGNSHGKSTVINTLSSVGSFLNLTFKKMDDMEFEKELYNFLKAEVADRYSKQFQQRNKYMPLLTQNLQENGNSMVDLEMYIDSGDDTTTGFYNYYLEYDKNYAKQGVIKEELSFRRKWNSKKIKVLFSIGNHFESEIGYKLLYKENIRNELKDNSTLLENFDNKIAFYSAFYTHYLKDSSSFGYSNSYSEMDAIIAIEKNKSYFEKIIRLVDNKIRSIEIVSDNEEMEDKLKFKCDKYDLEYKHLSLGTRKMIKLASHIYDIKEHGGVFIVDELDSFLNLELANKIVSIFQNLGKKNRSQLIFTTHNPELVNNLRKDQIYLLLKNEERIEAVKYANFISPITKKKIRGDCSFVKAYKTNLINNHPIDDIVNIVKSF